MDTVPSDEVISTIMMFNKELKILAFKIKVKSEYLVQTRRIKAFAVLMGTKFNELPEFVKKTK